MILVLAFLVLILSLIGLVARQVGAAVRIQTARAQQVARDEGVRLAAARALAMLETGEVTDSATVELILDTSGGPKSFVVTFSPESEGGGPGGSTIWTIGVAPAQ